MTSTGQEIVVVEDGKGTEVLIVEKITDQLTQDSEWVEQKMVELSNKDFGANKQQSEDSVLFVMKKLEELQRFKLDFNRRAVEDKSYLGDPLTFFIQAAYESSKDYCEKSLECLQALGKVGGVGDSLQTLSEDTAKTVIDWVDQQQKPCLYGSTTSLDSFSRCVRSLRANWCTIGNFVSCMQIQIRDAAEYHQFYHEVIECHNWMVAIQAKIRRIFSIRKILGVKEEAMNLLDSIREVFMEFMYWGKRTRDLVDRSHDIIPLKLRFEPVEHKELDLVIEDDTAQLEVVTKRKPVVVVTIAPYQTPEINVVGGEMLTLLDNTSRENYWLVRKLNNQATGYLPSIVCQVLPEDTEAIRAAMKLELQFKETWKNVHTMLNRKLIAYLLVIFRDWSKDEIQTFRKFSVERQDEIFRILEQIEQILKSESADNEMFAVLEVKISRIFFILESEPDENESIIMKTLVLQSHTLEQLLLQYKEFVEYWDNITSSSCSTQVTFWVSGTEEQDRNVTVVTSVYLNKYLTGVIEKGDRELKVQEEYSTLREGGRRGMHADEITETAEQENIFQSTQEEDVEYVISGVFDPETGEDVSLQDALEKGIIDQESGQYRDTVKDISITIQEAITEGYIKVEAKKVEMTKEHKKTVGLITIHHKKKEAEFSIRAVIDRRSGQEVSLTSAIKRGIIDENKGLYVDKQENTEMFISEAVEKGFIIVDEELEEEKEQVETKTYAVHNVYDAANDKQIPYDEGVAKGIVDIENNNFVDSQTKEAFSFPDAIAQGFMSAREVNEEEAASFDIVQHVMVKRKSGFKAKMKALGGMGAFKESSRSREDIIEEEEVIVTDM